MDTVAYNALSEQVLKPKKEALIKALQQVVDGKEPSFKPPMPDPQYYEIWFYYAFGFTYIFIGWQNFAVNVQAQEDQEKVEKIYKVFKSNFENEQVAERQFMKLKYTMEFDFFAECWAEVEERLDRKIPCFLMEHAVLNGLHVNDKVKIDANDISGILKKLGSNITEISTQAIKNN